MLTRQLDPVCELVDVDEVVAVRVNLLQQSLQPHL